MPPSVSAISRSNAAVMEKKSESTFGDAAATNTSVRNVFKQAARFFMPPKAKEKTHKNNYKALLCGMLVKKSQSKKHRATSVACALFCGTFFACRICKASKPRCGTRPFTQPFRHTLQ